MPDITLASILAARLRAAEAARKVIAPVRGEIALDDIATAYAVQQVNVDLRVANGERVVGRKIGLTSLAVQKQLGVDQPDFGALFASMAYGDGESIPLAQLNLITDRKMVESYGQVKAESGKAALEEFAQSNGFLDLMELTSAQPAFANDLIAVQLQ